MAPSRPFTGGAPEAPRGGTHILQGVVADRVKLDTELGLAQPQLVFSPFSLFFTSYKVLDL